MNSAVFALRSMPTDQGDALVAGGLFTNAGGAPASRIASWNGTEWASVGGGVDGIVRSLSVDVDREFGDVSLLVGGSFSSAGGQSFPYLARWNGSTWSAPIDQVNGAVLAIARLDDTVLLGGGFTQVSTPQAWPLSVDIADARSAALWAGDRLTPLRAGAGDEIWALEVFDDGSGPALYAAGKFLRIGKTQANHVARWDGKEWTPLGEGTNGWALSMAVYDDGSGEALYVAGNFGEAGGVLVNGIARWDGSSWSSLGSGLASATSGTQGLALIVYDDALYVTGRFTSAGDVPANNIAKWDGTSWSALGSGLESVTYDRGRALAVFDDGSGAGPALYVSGSFNVAGGVSVNNIAKWDGTGWSAVGSGLQMSGEGSTLPASVLAMRVYDDLSGSGPALYAAGRFDIAGGKPTNALARWDGQEWTSPGGISIPSIATVYDMAVYDDGAGPALFVTGQFAGDTGRAVTRWNGQSWSPLGDGLSVASPTVLAGLCLAVFDDALGLGPALYVGGAFAQAGSILSKQIARWQGCAPLASCPSDFNGDGVTDVADLLAVLSVWGLCAGCPEDLTGDDVVGLDDLRALLAAWGPCR